MIEGGKIIVKNLPQGTKFTTLDGVERELHKDDIMICDGDNNPMCIGGVFGGEETGVTEDHNSIKYDITVRINGFLCCPHLAESVYHTPELS